VSPLPLFDALELYDTLWISFPLCILTCLKDPSGLVSVCSMVTCVVVSFFPTATFEVVPSFPTETLEVVSFFPTATFETTVSFFLTAAFTVAVSFSPTAAFTTVAVSFFSTSAFKVTSVDVAKDNKNPNRRMLITLFIYWYITWWERYGIFALFPVFLTHSIYVVCEGEMGEQCACQKASNAEFYGRST